MTSFHINQVSTEMKATLEGVINNKTKPLGSLGVLENLAVQIGCIQKSSKPKLSKPTIVVFAADHGIAKEGVSPYPQEVTYQMVLNFLNGGAGINVFARQNNIQIKIVDAGVNFDFSFHPNLIKAKIGYGTKSYLWEPAMSEKECVDAIAKGAEIVAKIHAEGCNVIGFGEMGIGNTSSASLLMSLFCNIPLEECIGRGTGLTDEGLKKKISILSQAKKKHHIEKTSVDILKTFGGFEITMMCGAMLKAAELGMVILIDGFIATAALIAAKNINLSVTEYCVFCHQSDEQGHKRMLTYLGVQPLLQLGMRLGEGTGAAVAYPIVQAAVNFINEMASFESAGVSKE